MSSQPYPVYAAYPPSSFNSASTLNINTKAPLIDDERKHIPRTPSPTQTEYNYLNNIKEKKSLTQKIRACFYCFLAPNLARLRHPAEYYAIIAVLLVSVILISVYHTQIIDALKPFTDWLHNTPAGPLIPVVILIALSFPPLFGHELVSMIAGVSFGFPEACAVVAGTTILGEVANYYTFKYACTARIKKMEAKDISFGLLAHIIRNGGFLVVLVIRFSAIPPHFATAVFSTVGISFWTFLGAALLSLPKSFVPVYVGYALKPKNTGNTSSEKIEKIVLGATFLVTIGSYVWINRQMKAAKEDYIYQRRKARQAKVDGPHVTSMSDV
ncbi:hypothetical protein DFH06DRAFT_1000498 [Mycena polygramma]|nr:hypothetical protein DFH06DRAFT_1000498 [Mycena polygramma]